MSTTIEKHEILKIITPDISKSTYGDIIELKEKSLSFSPKENNFSTDDEIEIFTKSDEGNCYIKAKVVSATDDEVVVTFLTKWQILSKRDYKRVELRKIKKILLNSEQFDVVVEDISVNGMKFVADKKLEENFIYDLSLILDAKNTVKCKFVPLRSDIGNDNSDFQISGKFENIEKIDKIKLTQFCMKTQMENLYK